MGSRYGQPRYFQHLAGVTIGREVNPQALTALRMMPGQPTVEATRFATTIASDDYRTTMADFVRDTFDVWLVFDNSGPRTVGFRVPASAVPLDGISRFLTGDTFEGLTATLSGDDLLIQFTRFGADEDGFNFGETGEGWLELIAPVRDELIAGRWDVLRCGPFMGIDGDGHDRNPKRPAVLSKAARVLCSYLMVDLRSFEALLAEVSVGDPESDGVASTPQAGTAEPVTAELSEPTEGCCGEGGRWAPKAGEPHVQGCQLCPRSATYWRRGRVEAGAP